MGALSQFWSTLNGKCAVVNGLVGITVSRLIVRQKFDFGFFSKNLLLGIVCLLHFKTLTIDFSKVFFSKS